MEPPLLSSGQEGAVRSDWGIHVPKKKNGEPRSYLEFPNHLIVMDLGNIVT